MNNKKTLSIRFKSLLLWIIMSIAAILAFFFTTLLTFNSLKIRHKVAFYWTRLFNFCAENICGLTFEVIGKENIPLSPAIIASNHQSIWETLCFSSFFPPHVWVLKSSLLKIPFFGWALKACGPIPINRDNKRTAMKIILNVGELRIKEGFFILSFPEGTRLKIKERKPYQNGTARLAILLQKPIVPVAHNAGLFLPKNSLCLFPGKITVMVCPPILVDKDSNLPDLTLKLETTINNELDKLNV